MKIPSCKTIKSIIKTFGYNLTKIDLTEVSLSECDLRRVKFRKDKDIFQKIKDKNLSGTKLPCKDFSRYNFKGVLIKGVVFEANSMLPKGRNFFQSVRHKDISNTILPCLDYRHYNFKGVYIRGAFFPDDCLLTEDYNFFQKIKYKDCTNVHLPTSIVDRLHMFNLSGVAIDLSKYDLSLYQVLLLKERQG